MGSVALPLGDEEKFDWTPPDRRRRSVSPDVVPNLFRPRKESLVDVDFDHDRAASGLQPTPSFHIGFLVQSVLNSVLSLILSLCAVISS